MYGQKLFPRQTQNQANRVSAPKDIQKFNYRKNFASILKDKALLLVFSNSRFYYDESDQDYHQGCEQPVGKSGNS